MQRVKDRWWWPASSPRRLTVRTALASPLLTMDFQSLVGPDRTHDDQTFAVRVTRVGLHRVADGALSI
jgi:hypothetical protein